MKRWVEIAMVVAVAGCAGSPEKQSADPVAPAVEKQAVADERETSIDPNVLYLLMAAEVAGQRNQYVLALDGFLQAARQVNDPRIAERAAKIALFLKDSKSTEEAVGLWLKNDPDNLTARKIATLSALRGANKKEAIEHLNASMRLDPAGFESTLLEMSKLMEKDSKDEFVFDVLEELSVQHPDQAVISFVQAVLASKLQKNDVAQEKISAALSIQPEWNKALIVQAQIAGRAGDLETAKENLEKALQQAPEDRRLRKMLAQVLVDTKEHDEAIELYRQVLQEKPDDGESQFAIALIQLQQKQLDSAQKSLEALLHNPAWTAQASFYLGRIEYGKENYDQALVWFDKVTQGPYAFDAAMAAVSVLSKQQRYEEVMLRINELEQKFPRQRLRVLLAKAEMYSSGREYQKAFDVLTEALQSHPNSRDLLYTRALVAEQIDKLDVLEADLRKILAEKPDDAGALNALGYTLVDRTDRYDEAEEYLLQALRLQPDAAVIIDSYGWLKYKKGDMQQALQYLQQAFDKQPENEIAAHLAEVLWVTGKKKDAMRIFEKAFKKSPEDQYLLDFQKRFLLIEE